MLADIGLPKASGIEAIIAIREACPDTQFCMFTVFEDNQKIYKSLMAGAKGYILKNSDPDRIINAIKELHAGGSPMNPEIARKVIDAFSQGNVSNPEQTPLPITKREMQLLELLVINPFNLIVIMNNVMEKVTSMANLKSILQHDGPNEIQFQSNSIII